MNNIKVQRKGDTLIIGDSPQLVVNLKNQDNYITVQNKRIPYHREVLLSNDLLEGKRRKVFVTAVTHYYQKACEVAEGVKAAEAYRPMVNSTVREIR